MTAFPHQIVVQYCPVDQSYLAVVPSMPNCLAYADAPEQAVTEVMIAHQAMTEALGQVKDFTIKSKRPGKTPQNHATIAP